MGLLSVSIQPLCLFIGTFSPFAFKGIIDTYVLIAILLLVWGLFFVVLFCCFALLLLSSLVI